MILLVKSPPSRSRSKTTRRTISNAHVLENVSAGRGNEHDDCCLHSSEHQDARHLQCLTYWKVKVPHCFERQEEKSEIRNDVGDLKGVIVLAVIDAMTARDGSVEGPTSNGSKKTPTEWWGPTPS